MFYVAFKSSVCPLLYKRSPWVMEIVSDCYKFCYISNFWFSPWIPSLGQTLYDIVNRWKIHLFQHFTDVSPKCTNIWNKIKESVFWQKYEFMIGENKI